MNEIHYMDIDDTLFHHPKDDRGVKVHVNDKNGNRIMSLTSAEYPNHKLRDGELYDFCEFVSADKFAETALPIFKMIEHTLNIHKNGGKIELLTGRSDMDNPDKFGEYLNSHGLNIDEIHVRRAGNIKGRASETKKLIVSEAIKHNKYNTVHLYDDSHENLNHFLSLKNDYPDVTFNAHHVHHDEESGITKVTTTRV